MIDVLEKIKNLLIFDSDDDFYLLQIMQRKKENRQIGSNSRIVKNYFINSIEYLENRYDEIKELCDQFNARAMLRLNKRSYRKVAFKALQNMANSISNGEYSFTKKSYIRACGNGHNDKNKKWIIDIDNMEVRDEYLQEMFLFINNCKPEGDKLIVILPTKNGIHLITKPFDTRFFKGKYADVDIHKDNPINLYIPEKLTIN